MRASPLKSSFNAGEISPLLAGRSDVAKYANGCFELSNFIPTVQGPARRRPGTRYVANTKSNGRSWLSRFEYSVAQSYVIEWCDYKVRFFYNQAPVMDPITPANVYEVVTPYSLASLTTAGGTFALDFAQSADVLYIVHPDYPPAKLSRNGHTDWAFVLLSFIDGPLSDLNTSTTTVSSLGYINSEQDGGATIRGVLCYLQAGQLTRTTGSPPYGFVASGSYPSYPANTEPRYELLKASTLDFWTDTMVGGCVRIEPNDLSEVKPWTAGQEIAHYGDTTLGILRRSDGKTYSCATNISLAAAKVLQCGGDMPIHTSGTQCDGGGSQVEGTTVQRQGVDWTFTDYGFTSYRIWEIKRHTSTRTCTTTTSSRVISTGQNEITAMGGADPIQELMYVSGTGVPSGCQVVKITTTGVEVYPAITAGATGITLTFRYEFAIGERLSSSIPSSLLTSGDYVIAPTSITNLLYRYQPTVGTDPVVQVGMVIHSNAFPEGTTVTAINSASGHTSYYTLSNNCISTSTVLQSSPSSSNLYVGFSKPSKRWRTPAYGDGYPTAVTFFRERLVFAGGQKVYCSASADFENFAPLNSSGNVTAATAITATISSDQVNNVQWLAPQRALMIGTNGGEFAMMESSIQEPFGPGNVKIEQHGADGSRSGVKPGRVGTAALFVQRAGKKLKECSFDNAKQGYSSKDLTVLAEHITRDSGILQLAWHKEPYTTLWAVREDGVLLGLTYNTDQDVIAWHKHPLAGGALTVESITVIPTPDGTADQLWLSVYNGTARWVMFMESESVAKSSSFYVDGGLSYSGGGATTVSGITHFNPTTVAALADVDGMKRLGVVADDSVQPPVSTTSTSVTLSRSATRISVGYNYDSRIIPTTIDAGGQDGTSFGKVRRTNKISLGLFQTRGGTWTGAGSAYLSTPTAYTLGQWNSIVPERFRGNVGQFDAATSLFSGVTVIDWEGDYVLDDTITLRQCEPLPMTVTSIMPQFKVYDR